jgi:hypothetical protein
MRPERTFLEILESKLPEIDELEKRYGPIASRKDVDQLWEKILTLVKEAMVKEQAQ